MASAVVTGIDIGSTTIRVVETGRSKREASVANFGQIGLPPGIVEGGTILDAPAVTAAIKKLWSQNKFKNRDVVLGVTSSQVLVREMTLPNLPAGELKQTLPFQVRELLPMPVEKALLDFYPLEDPGSAETVLGLVVAAPKESVLTTVRTVEKAGLRVKSVDLASFAILRAAAVLRSPVEGIADLGAHASTIVVHADGRPLIVRTVPRGGVELTSVLAERLSISTDEAERLKCIFGLRPQGTEQAGQASAPGQDDHIGRVAGILAEALRPLLSEIRSSFTYARSVNPAAAAASLALTGGCAMLPGLIEHLRHELGLDVQLADTLSHLHDPRQRGKHNELALYRMSAATSIGLTLGAA